MSGTYRLQRRTAIRAERVDTPLSIAWRACGEFSSAVRRRASAGVRYRCESQAHDSLFAEFPEIARWTYGGFVFATIHVVGSRNGGEPFRGRTAANDAEVARRTRAAIAWLDEAFAKARVASAKGLVLAIHGDIGFHERSGSGRAYAEFAQRLMTNVAGFPGPVLLIHGDSHIQRVDHPLRDGEGRSYPNFTRLETFGSPDIGWVRVVVDTVAGRVTSYEPRLMR